MAFAPRTITAPELQDRVAFDQRQQIDDQYGGTAADFVEQFVVYARINRKLGGERIIAERLDGQNPVLITVRSSSDTDEIETDWRARDVRSGEVYNIRSIADAASGGFLEILCERGVTT